MGANMLEAVRTTMLTLLFVLFLEISARCPVPEEDSGYYVAMNGADILEEGDYVNANEIVGLRCFKGYKVVGDPMTCTGDGSWGNIQQYCDKLPEDNSTTTTTGSPAQFCSSPPKFSGSSCYSYPRSKQCIGNVEQLEIGTTIKFTCADRLRRIYCRSDGVWVRLNGSAISFKDCQTEQACCLVPSPGYHRYFSIKSTNSIPAPIDPSIKTCLPVGSEILVNCLEGYELSSSGNQVLKCRQKNLQFESTAAWCDKTTTTSTTSTTTPQLRSAVTEKQEDYTQKTILFLVVALISVAIVTTVAVWVIVDCINHSAQPNPPQEE